MCVCNGTFSLCSPLLHCKRSHHECACRRTGEWLLSARGSALTFPRCLSQIDYLMCNVST